MPKTYTVWLLDSWGNAEEGWEANDQSRHGTVVIPDDADDEEFIDILKASGFLSNEASEDTITIGGDDEMITVDDAETGEPLYTLELKEVEEHDMNESRRDQDYSRVLGKDLSHEKPTENSSDADWINWVDFVASAEEVIDFAEELGWDGSGDAKEFLLDYGSGACRERAQEEKAESEANIEKCCPDCEKPNQFGERCDECARERSTEEEWSSVSNSYGEDGDLTESAVKLSKMSESVAPPKPKNLMGKTRPIDKPYEIWQAGDWEWRVLKAWQADPYKPNARWFCAVKSPMTYGSWDMGDTYVADVVKYAHRTYRDPSLPEDVSDTTELSLAMGGYHSLRAWLRDTGEYEEDAPKSNRVPKTAMDELMGEATQTGQKWKWAVFFRRVAPRDEMTPLMYLPKETMGGFIASDAKEAWQKFLEEFPIEQRSWYHQTEPPVKQHNKPISETEETPEEFAEERNENVDSVEESEEIDAAKIKRKARLLGLNYDTRKKSDIEWFKNLSAEDLNALIDEGFADPKDAQNNAPAIKAFLAFMEKHPGVTAHGYAIFPPREDQRVSIEGLAYDWNPLGVDYHQIPQLVADFKKFCKGADELDINRDARGNITMRSWWD